MKPPTLKYFAGFIILCAMTLACTKDKMLPTQENAPVVPVDTTNTTDTTGIIDSTSCGNNYYNNLGRCYSYLDSVGLNPWELTCILIGSWKDSLRNNILTFLCDTDMMTADGRILTRKGILITNDSIIEYFGWNTTGDTNHSSPFFDGINMCSHDINSVFYKTYCCTKGCVSTPFFLRS